ncbi:unnamed protein product [Prunus armeniaca]
MEDLRRCLERQERETNERSRRRAERQRLQREEDEQVVIAVALLDEENQGRCRGSQVDCGPNVDRHRHSRGKNLLEDYFIPTSLYSDIDFRMRYRMQPHLFNKVMHDICNYDAYFVQKCDASEVLGLLLEQKLAAVIRMLTYGSSTDQVNKIARMGKSTTLEALVRFCDAVETLYTRDYLHRPTPRDLQRLLQKAEARGFPRMIGSIDCMHWQWNCLAKEITEIEKAKKVSSLKPLLASIHGFGMLSSELPNPKMTSTCSVVDYSRCGPYVDEEVLKNIMMTCIILHNMIVEDEYDYDATGVYELDPMNTTLT